VYYWGPRQVPAPVLRTELLWKDRRETDPVVVTVLVETVVVAPLYLSSVTNAVFWDVRPCGSSKNSVAFSPQSNCTD
jgi:hypothetical protein